MTEAENTDRKPASVRRNQSFKRLNHVLNRVMTSLGLEKRLKEHTLMNLWPVLAGAPWSRKSRPLFIDNELKLVVAVADASTGQELSMMKPQLLKQLKMAAAALSLKIEGLRFDLKHYHQEAEADPLSVSPGSPSWPEPTRDDLWAVSLDSHDLNEIENLKVSLSAADSGNDLSEFGSVSADRIINLLEYQLRLRQWRRAHGYPLCRLCDMPSPGLHGAAGVCATCFLQSSS